MKKFGAGALFIQLENLTASSNKEEFRRTTCKILYLIRGDTNKQVFFCIVSIKKYSCKAERRGQNYN